MRALKVQKNLVNNMHDPPVNRDGLLAGIRAVLLPFIPNLFKCWPPFACAKPNAFASTFVAEFHGSLPFSFVCSLPSTSDDAPERCRLSDPTQRARPETLVLSFRQLRVSQTLSGNRSDKRVETLQRVDSHVAKVQPERKFVNVSVKVLFARVMVNAMKTALEQSPNGLNRVCRDVPAPPFTLRVIDTGMTEEKTAYATVCAVLVTVECRANFAVFMDRRLNGRQIVGFNRQGFGAAIALAHSEDGLLSDRAAPLFQLLIFMLRVFQTAYKSLINLNDATQLVDVFPAGFAETLQHEPRRLLSDTNLFGKLHRTDALAGRDEQVHRVNPLVKGHMRPLKDRSGANGERELLAAVAAVVALRSSNDAIPALALRTDNAIRPQAAFGVPAQH